MGVGLSI